MAKRWKKEEETYLKRYSKSRRLSELAERFGADTEAVEAKLEELGLEAKDTIVKMKIENDPVVKVFERGVREFHKGRYKEARDLMKQVVEQADFPQVGQRARRFLTLCEQHLAKPSPEAEDAFLLAVYERNRGKLEDALELCTRGGRQGKDERFAYLAAALHTLLGDHEKAAHALGVAIEMNPKNRVYAFHDADFQELRSSEEYASLFEQP